MILDRRQFLKTVAGSAATLAVAPAALGKAAFAQSAGGPLFAVAVELNGGWDHLSVLWPNDVQAAAKAQLLALRPNLYPFKDAPALMTNSTAWGFHTGLAGLLQRAGSHLAILHNAGMTITAHSFSHEVAQSQWKRYVLPNQEATVSSGILGRLLDAPDIERAVGGRAVESIAFGGNSQLLQPIGGNRPRVVGSNLSFAYRNPSGTLGTIPCGTGCSTSHGNDFTYGVRPSVNAALANDVAATEPEEAFIRSSRSIEDTIKRFAEASATPISGTITPNSGFTSAMQSVAKYCQYTVNRNSDSMVLYTANRGGFDTHQQQVNAFSGTLPDLSNGLSLLIDAAVGGGWFDRLAIIVLSEFGRTLKQNGSFGTDHANANCVLLMGGRVVGGHYNDSLDLNDLTTRNYLRVQTDWMGPVISMLKDHLGVPEALLREHVFINWPAKDLGVTYFG